MVHQVGPPAPEGCMGQVWEGTSPRWAGAPPHQGPRRMGEWEGANPRSRWALRPTLVAPPLSSPWPPPRWDLGLAATPRGGNLGGGAAPPLPLYILEVLGCHRHDSISFLAQPYPSPSSSLVVLGEALLEYHAPPPPPCRRAATGWSLPQPLLLPLLDQGVGDVTGLYMC